jgi:fatty acid desaturase
VSDAAATPREPGIPPEHRASIKAINAAILAEEKRVRAQHGWLAHQDLIGFACWLGSILAVIGLAAAYIAGVLPWWLAVPLIALPISILHELEHDLIHSLFFKGRPWMQNVMFTGIWFLKQNLNPWTRRDWHLLHHRRSGQIDDIEERLIGLGLPLGWRRVASWFPLGSGLIMPGVLRDIIRARQQDKSLTLPKKIRGSAYFRLSMDGLFYASPLLFLAGWWLGHEWCRTAFIVLSAPNLVRHACIVFISSYSHYYGDVRDHDVMEQNQVLSHPLFWPGQLFCFNFGSTHIIHHYVVQQPFYLRQMVAAAAHAEMKKQGVRFNDLGVFRRANRRGEYVPQAAVAA